MGETQSYGSFIKSIERGSIQRLYALEGSETYLAGKARGALRAALLPAGLESLNETVLDNPSADKLIEAAETLPAFANRRLVYVRAMDILTAERARDAQAQSDALANYLPRVPDTVCLVFRIPADTDKRRAAVKALYAAACVVQCVTPSDAEIERFIRREVVTGGASIEPEAAAFLINWSGRDLTRLVGEIGKLCAYRKGLLIREEDIRALSIRTEESTVFQWLDALLDGKGAASLTILDSLVESGENVFALLALAERRLRQLLYIDHMTRERRSATDIAKQLGLPDFVVRREMQKARSLQLTRGLRAGLDLLMDTNEAIRSGRIAEATALPRIQFGLSAIIHQ
ncbi:hypothetical protein AGMMS49992_00180 [Clostridia bacterium]|nr:hypothetical protein AGMMS49992_00180 [Clostridia bacterium]